VIGGLLTFEAQSLIAVLGLAAAIEDHLHPNYRYDGRHCVQRDKQNIKGWNLLGNCGCEKHFG